MRILIDGSNVMYWRGDQADVCVVRLVVGALTARRFAPTVYFDHSIGQTPAALAAAVGLAEGDVIVAPRGTPADPLLLSASDAGRVQIVSRDRFRAWHAAFPGLRASWLVTGEIGKGGRVSFSKKLRAAPL